MAARSDASTAESAFDPVGDPVGDPVVDVAAGPADDPAGVTGRAAAAGGGGDAARADGTPAGATGAPMQPVSSARAAHELPAASNRRDLDLAGRARRVARLPLIMFGRTPGHGAHAAPTSRG